jgi:hypothetical protein
MSGKESLATLDVVHAEIARLQTYSLEVMVRLDDTGYAKEIGAHDTARLISTRHRRNLGAVRRDLALAKALPKYAAVTEALPDPHAPAGPDPTIQYADDAAAPSDGTVLPVVLHPDQAQAIVAALEAVPAAAMVPVEDLRVAEEQMVQAGRHLPPWELTRLGRQVRNLLDTDGPEPAEEAAARREAFWLKNVDQGVKFGGYLSSERAALLRTLIEPAAKPRKTPEGEPDPRPREKRQADRFSDILHLAAGTGELPGSGGVKPHITVTMDLADLIAAGKDATGDLMFGDSLSAGAVRRLACDAEIIPVMLGAESEPLDVGRAKRLITPAMRKALNLRDKGCVVCGAAPIYCDAHHIISWLAGGPTSIDNLALFCRAHHIDVDNGHYTVTITNGVVHLRRPSWADPPPTRRPSIRHRPRSGAATPGPVEDADPAAGQATGVDRAAGPATRVDPAAGPDTSVGPAAGSDRPVGSTAGVDPAVYWGTDATAGWNDKRSGAGSGSSDGGPSVRRDDWGGSVWDDFDGTPSAGADVGGESIDRDDAVGKHLRPVRAHPLVGDPPPLVADPGFDPWGPETLDTG